MARRVFYSFHYELDCWRAAQVRNMGIVEGNAPASDNDWETIKKGGEVMIQRWIDGQLLGRSCTVVLIGAKTAGRKWINYEIENSWNEGKGLVGIYVHHLKDSYGQQSAQGANPFDWFTVGAERKSMSSIVRVYNPPYWQSQAVYEYIRSHLAGWIDEAVQMRGNYGGAT